MDMNVCNLTYIMVKVCSAVGSAMLTEFSP
jgi:hypothetical protein